MYTLATPSVKYMLPGATAANYEVFGGTHLHNRAQGCTKLGGAVRVSNRLLIPDGEYMRPPGRRGRGLTAQKISSCLRGATPPSVASTVSWATC